VNHSVDELEPYDPRAIANSIVLQRRSAGLATTHLTIQKLTYFCHARYLVSRERPLVQGYFEAWQHGPVHPALYAAFKENGNKPVARLAERKNIRTGELTVVSPPSREDIHRFIAEVTAGLSQLTSGQLVALSHARDGPWDIIHRRSKRERMIGPRIPNELIRDRAKYHLIFADERDGVRPEDEDTPITLHGFG